MKKFFRQLLDNQDSTSSKRFVALVGLGIFCILAISSMFGATINTEILYTTISLIFIPLGMTLVKK